jgi:hypothetical protein
MLGEILGLIDELILREIEGDIEGEVEPPAV